MQLETYEKSIGEPFKKNHRTSLHVSCLNPVISSEYPMLMDDCLEWRKLEWQLLWAAGLVFHASTVPIL